MKLKSNVRLLITCDSGAGAGKTTASKYFSKQFGLNLLTSGLLYRYVAYKLLASKKTSFLALGWTKLKLFACSACLLKLFIFFSMFISIFLNLLFDFPYDLSPKIGFPLKFICTLIWWVLPVSNLHSIWLILGKLEFWKIFNVL